MYEFEENDIENLIDYVQKRKNLLTRDNKSKELLISILYNSKFENEVLLEEEYNNINYSLNSYKKYYIIQKVSFVISLLSVIGYKLTSDEKCLLSAIFFLSIFLIDCYFLKDENKKIEDEKYLIIYSTFIQNYNSEENDKLLEENELIKEELKKINTILEFLKSLTKEEQEKYLKLKM